MEHREFTERQKLRLPDPGYWLCSEVHNEIVKGHIAYCIMNGRINYIRDDLPNHRPNWGTLLWSCMTTRKQIGQGIQTFHGMKYYYHKWERFNTLEEMKLAHPELEPEFFIKPINDY
jgi:hypothetical protein